MSFYVEFFFSLYRCFLFYYLTCYASLMVQVSDLIKCFRIDCGLLDENFSFVHTKWVFRLDE